MAEIEPCLPTYPLLDRLESLCNIDEGSSDDDEEEESDDDTEPATTNDPVTTAPVAGDGDRTATTPLPLMSGPSSRSSYTRSKLATRREEALAS